MQLCSATTSINDYQADGNSVSAYPNPFSTSTILEFNLLSTNSVSINIVDVTGRIVKLIHKSNFQIGKNQITIDLSDVTSGIYFCEVKSNGSLETYRLIKN